MIPGLASLLDVEQKDVVLISENTSGGFRSKIGAYPMMALSAWFPKKLGRPVQLRITREQESDRRHHGTDHGQGRKKPRHRPGLAFGLNASIHLRALLTDLVLVSEAARPREPE